VVVLAQRAAVAQVAEVVLAKKKAVGVSQDLKQDQDFAQHHLPEVVSTKDSQPQGMI